MAEKIIDLNGPGLYEVQNWKPIRLEYWLEELAQTAYTLDHEIVPMGRPSELKHEVTELPDHRVRYVNYAYVKPENFDGHSDQVAPYLMRLYEPELSKSVYFIRTGVTLCMP